MPATYWLPLPAVRRPVAVEHLHAAFSRWFDVADDDGPTGLDAHHENIKPYRLAPVSRRGDEWGMEASLLSEEAFERLAARIDGGDSVRLGTLTTPVGTPVVVQGETWQQLAEWGGDSAWEVTFLTPFAVRPGRRTSPFPAPQVVLSATTDAWARYSGRTPLRVTPADQAHLWVSHLEVTTTTFSLNGHRHPGALGSITYRADTSGVARVASSLLRLAAYCGMGSFRGKGMGVVSVTPL